MNDNLTLTTSRVQSVSGVDIYYLRGSLAIAKTQLNGLCDKQCTTGAILVQEQRIIAIGYDEPKKGELAEVMALKQVNYRAQGATLYTSMAPTRLPTYSALSTLLNSQIARLVYGYCEPAVQINSHICILQQIEQAKIHCIYLRLPEILRFYAPYRFAEAIISLSE